MESEWENLPYMSQNRLPITAAIPMYYRWKILQVKLLIKDLNDLAEKHGIHTAKSLAGIVALEAIDLCALLEREIVRIRVERRELTK